MFFLSGPLNFHHTDPVTCCTHGVQDAKYHLQHISGQRMNKNYNEAALCFGKLPFRNKRLSELRLLVTPFSLETWSSLRTPAPAHVCSLPCGAHWFGNAIAFSVGLKRCLPRHIFFHSSVTVLCFSPTPPPFLPPLFSLPVLSRTFSACRCINRAVFN